VQPWLPGTFRACDLFALRPALNVVFLSGGWSRRERREEFLEEDRTAFSQLKTALDVAECTHKSALSWRQFDGQVARDGAAVHAHKCREERRNAVNGAGNQFLARAGLAGESEPGVDGATFDTRESNRLQGRRRSTISSNRTPNRFLRVPNARSRHGVAAPPACDHRYRWRPHTNDVTLPLLANMGLSGPEPATLPVSFLNRISVSNADPL